MGDETTNGHLGLKTAGCVSALVALYFVLPVLFMIPLQFVKNRGYITREVGVTFFKPMAFCLEHVPYYLDWIALQVVYCEKHGLLEPDK